MLLEEEKLIHYNYVSYAKIEGACILIDQMGYHIDVKFSEVEAGKYQKYFKMMKFL